MSSCPSICCEERKSAPLANRWLANAWRNLCGLIFFIFKPALSDNKLRSCEKRCLVICPTLDCLDGKSHLTSLFLLKKTFES